MKEKAEII
jgi:hypothetical protein